MSDSEAVQQGLAKLEGARLMLATCTSVDAVKDLRDQAGAVAAYYRQRGASLEVQNDASEIRLRAERRLGELLREMPKHTGGSPPRNGAKPPALGEIGITWNQSSMWQRIASLPEEEFDSRIAEAKENALELTTSRMLKGVVLDAARASKEPAKENRRVLDAIEEVRRVHDQREAWVEAAKRLQSALDIALKSYQLSAERAAVEVAMNAVVDCDSEDDGAYRRAWERFRNAALAWLASTAGAKGRLRAMYRVKHPSAGIPPELRKEKGA